MVDLLICLFCVCRVEDPASVEFSSGARAPKRRRWRRFDEWVEFGVAVARLYSGRISIDPRRWRWHRGGGSDSSSGGRLLLIGRRRRIAWRRRRRLKYPEQLKLRKKGKKKWRRASRRKYKWTWLKPLPWKQSSYAKYTIWREKEKKEANNIFKNHTENWKDFLWRNPTPHI